MEEIDELNDYDLESRIVKHPLRLFLIKEKGMMTLPLENIIGQTLRIAINRMKYHDFLFILNTIQQQSNDPSKVKDHEILRITLRLLDVMDDPNKLTELKMQYT